MESGIYIDASLPLWNAQRFACLNPLRQEAGDSSLRNESPHTNGAVKGLSSMPDQELRLQPPLYPLNVPYWKIRSCQGNRVWPRVREDPLHFRLLQRSNNSVGR